MVGLDPQVVESVALTRQEGEAFLLDGNKLYFEYWIKGKHGQEEAKYGYVDLSISRKTFKTVQWSEVPQWPRRQEISVNVNEVAYGLWWQRWAGLPHKVVAGSEYLPVRSFQSNQVSKLRNQVTLDDFTRAIEGDCSCVANDKGQDVKPSWWWGITDGLMEQAKELAHQREREIDQVVNAGWKPMPQLDAEKTSFVLGIFNFDGDKKSLVTALLSWGVEIEDRQVDIDKILTKKIKLPKTVEELIP